MKHSYRMDGFGYRLRPVTENDIQFIIKIRTEDAQRNKYIHKISSDIESQKEWLNDYYKRENDYYFVIENRINTQPEGLIAFYNQVNNCAEWGRWVLKRGSLAAAESVYLIYKIAFEIVGLDELYCRTIKENKAVVSFHDSIGEILRESKVKYIELNGKQFEVVEQYSGKLNFYNKIAPLLQERSNQIFIRNARRLLGKIEFHHIGVAVKNIIREVPSYALLGYKPEGEIFVDQLQGVRGIFISANGQPRLELLENIENSDTLSKQINQGQRMYHTAYCVENIEKWRGYFIRNRGKVLSPIKKSTYFGKGICFIILPNMAIIELIEK